MAGIGGAHITSTTSSNASIFDVVAQNSLMESLQPALQHVMKVMAEYNPSRYSVLYRWADEIFLLLHFALERHYLLNYGASFSENFYDLKRVPLASFETTSKLRLPRHVLQKSIFTLVLFPYIKKQLENKYRELDESTERTSGVKNVFVTLWPFLHMVMESITLLYYIRYLIGRQKVHSPLLHLSGAFLSYLSQEDFEYIEAHSSNINLANVRSMKGFIRWSSELLGYVLQNSLEVGAFFLQFLNMFYSNHNTSTNLLDFGDTPPPPIKLYPNLEENVCPLCNSKLKEPTALAISGITFCYSCILIYMKQHSKCPVTGYPATTKQLIKIYLDE